VTAQGNIQTFFNSVAANSKSWSAASNVTVATNVVLDFVDESVTVDGIKVGGKIITAREAQNSDVMIRARVERGSRARRNPGGGFWPAPTGAVHVHTGWVVDVKNEADN
jgi:hypothetical protein